MTIPRMCNGIKNRCINKRQLRQGFCTKKLIYMSVFYISAFVFADNTNLQDTQESSKHYKLQAATVTATRVPTTIDEAPGNVSVISKKDINIRPNLKISDTLRGIEGLRQSKSRGMDTFDSVTIRGIASGATIMLDGVILNDMDNNTKMITAMSASDLEQVEVIRGPFSNLYGSGALSGGINFVTSMPDKLSLEANLGYGNPFVANKSPENLVRGYFSIGDVFFDKKLKVKASYGFTTTDGYAADSTWVYKGDTILNNATGGIPSKNPQGTDIVIIGDMGKQKYQTHDLKLRAQYEPTETITLDSGFMFDYYGYYHNDQQSYLRKDGEPYFGDNKNTCSNGSCNGGTSGNRPMPMYFGRGIGQERFAQSIFYFGYKQQFDEIMLSAKYSRIDGWRDFNNPDGGVNSNNESSANTTLTGGQGSQTKDRFQTNNLDIFANIPTFSSTQNIMVGFQARQLSMDENIFNLNNWTNYSSSGSNYAGMKGKRGGKSLMTGVFVELRSDWSSFLSTTLGLRYDYWLGYDYYTIDNSQAKNNSKQKISPKATLNYYINDTSTIKASVGQGFRAPTLSQMFSTYKTNNGITTIGNPNLKPETATSFDIGFEQKIQLFGEYGGLAKAYYFNTFMSDIIYSNLNGTTQTMQNGGLALINGLELSYKQNLPYNLSVLITYTFTNSDMIKNPADKSIEGNKLTGVPEHLGYVQIAYDDTRFFGSFGIEMMSKPFARADNKDTIGGVYSATDGYVLGDVRVGYRFLDYYEVALNVTNIFNDKYYSYYLAPGAAFFLQASAKF